MKPEPLKDKGKKWEDIVAFEADDRQDVFLKKDIKLAVEFFRQYSDSGRDNFKNDFPEEYEEYENEGIKEGWDIILDESWNDWLLDKAFEDVTKTKGGKDER